MSLPVRTTLAALAVTLAVGASAALAAPVPSLANQPSLVISVVDDSTSENDAITIERNQAPSMPAETKSHMAPMAESKHSACATEAPVIQDEKAEAPTSYGSKDAY
jgi:hypothetical protein